MCVCVCICVCVCVCVCACVCAVHYTTLVFGRKSLLRWCSAEEWVVVSGQHTVGCHRVCASGWKEGGEEKERGGEEERETGGGGGRGRGGKRED